AWIAATLLARRGGAQLAAASVVLCTCAALTIVGGAFTVRFTRGINDRYLFYVAPLLFVGLAAAPTALAASKRARWFLVPASLAVGWLVWSAGLTQHGPSLIS